MERVLKLIKSKTTKNIAYYSCNMVIRLIYCIISFIVPVSKNKVVIFNYNGKGYGDNPKYVAKEIYKTDKNAKIVWLVQKEDKMMPNFIKQVKFYSLLGMITCASSKVWISNARLPLFLIKKKNQIYFQLWHGGCGPKKIEGAAKDKLIRWYISAAKHDSKMADYLVSNSKFNSEIFKKYFWYSGEILNYGSPRHDIFFYNNNEVLDRVDRVLGISKDKKVILYAPTFRDDKKLDIYKWDYQAVIEAMNRKYGGDWVFICRLHPNISFLDTELNYSNNIINGSKYDDMQELIKRADLVITDYSGVMMQAALARKLVLLLIPDKDKYKNDRGLCIDIEKTPFLQGNSYNDLIELINSHNSEVYSEKLDEYLSKFGFYDDGHASERVASMIKKLIN
ncbi:CDP-glycerol glycerophosphotransferase family protein [Clostridium saudiense]|uniref:CDP-glycerol glycerophosphotransferase family protein n=1 Tax=Clostridium saudiense TaxID=1414720 RepID=UPI00266E9D9D|nr:CDP-glycerol glycerophosphotransferase family protein [Clostridium saudiense]